MCRKLDEWSFVFVDILLFYIVFVRRFFFTHSLVFCVVCFCTRLVYSVYCAHGVHIVGISSEWCVEMYSQCDVYGFFFDDVVAAVVYTTSNTQHFSFTHFNWLIFLVHIVIESVFHFHIANEAVSVCVASMQWNALFCIQTEGKTNYAFDFSFHWVEKMDRQLYWDLNHFSALKIISACFQARRHMYVHHAYLMCIEQFRKKLEIPQLQIIKQKIAIRSTCGLQSKIEV